MSILAVVLTLTACKKKEETLVEPPKPEVVAKPEPVVVAKPAEPVKPRFAWWSRTAANELLVPDSKEEPLTNPKSYTRAFCERSGALELSFTGTQEGDAEKLDTGMPLDIEVDGKDMRGAKFKVTKGTLKEDERICLVVDEAFASSVTLLELKDASGECAADQKKSAGALLKGMKTCNKQSAGEVSAFELESEDNSGVALITPSSKIFVELGDPNGEYGAGVMDLVVVLKKADGSYLAVTCNMAHESITTSLNVLGKSALEEVTSTLYYNAAGG